MSIKIRRQVAPGAEVFRLTYQDDVDGLKQLFSNGLASPNDISYIDGTTPLGVSTFFYLRRLPEFSGKYLSDRKSLHFRVPLHIAI